MEHIKTKIEDHILSIFLDRGKSNAIDTQLLKELIDTLESSQQNEAIYGAILIGKENFFSAGLDLITLFQYDEEQIQEFWNLFLEATSLLAAFPKPIVAAISGHSPAAAYWRSAAIIALWPKGNFVIGLNEIQSDSSSLKVYFSFMHFGSGKRNAYQNLLEGKLLSPVMQKHRGLSMTLFPLIYSSIPQQKNKTDHAVQPKDGRHPN
jgi:hypothetical protein